MSEADLWAAIVAFVMPLLVAMIVKQPWQDDLKALVAFVACIVFAAGTAYFSAELNASNVIRDFLIIFVGGMTFWARFWRPLGVTGFIEKNILP